ncbi:VRR-NUC domain-containing protein [Arthrobacter rhombi]|uniref:VRR-NUC domain-containing protein n=1 Tax=Arthrobacter rhombi TaxID=71253 RepID=UPI003FD61149
MGRTADVDPDRGREGDPVSTGGLAGQVLAWSEKEFQEQVLNAAQALGWSLRYHVFDSRRSEPGFPDLVLVHPVRRWVLFRELKTEKGRTTAKQDDWINGLNGAGMDAGVWRPRDWASNLIQSELSGMRVRHA